MERKRMFSHLQQLEIHEANTGDPPLAQQFLERLSNVPEGAYLNGLGQLAVEILGNFEGVRTT